MLLAGLLQRPMAAAAAAAAPSRTWLHTSSVLEAAKRSGGVKHKLKTHTGTKKRFFPVQGTSRGNAASIKFKRTMPNKQHLNSGMPRVRLNRLGGTTMVSGGAMAKVLRRMLGPRM